MKNTVLWFFLCFLLSTPLLAQTPTAPPLPTAVPTTLILRPIDSRFTTLDGMSYVMNGETLQSYDDLRDVISPLKDHEANRLLDRSQSSDDVSRILKIVGFLGLAGGVAGVLTTNNSSDQTSFFLLAAGGELTFDVGLLFGAEAQTAKFNAVQRYDRFAYGREQILPQAPTDERSLLPGVAPIVTVVPAAVPTAGH